MKKENRNYMFKDICKYLGEDLDSLPCKSIKRHLEKCKNCEIFVDKLKKIVTIYKKLDEEIKVPEKAKRELFAKINFNPEDFEKNNLS
ncbi:MAG: hypothetical protein H0Z29_02165 [Candidatus Marinimicrobia bacterium]|nr:hypothetical protein [Candidatus Neomarinimicrobiota bacterium]